MSKAALQAFFRLQPAAHLDGMAIAVLLYLAVRYDDSAGCAWPSLRKMASDLAIHKGRAVKAIERLVSAGLVTVDRSGRSNRYRLPWLSSETRSTGSESPIYWPPDGTKRSGGPDHDDRSGPPDRSEGSRAPDRYTGPGVRGTSTGGRVEHEKSVGSPRPENKKTEKTERARTADEVFQERLLQNRRAAGSGT